MRVCYQRGLPRLVYSLMLLTGPNNRCGFSWRYITSCLPLTTWIFTWNCLVKAKKLKKSVHISHMVMLFFKQCSICKMWRPLAMTTWLLVLSRVYLSTSLYSHKVDTWYCRGWWYQRQKFYSFQSNYFK